MKILINSTWYLQLTLGVWLVLSAGSCGKSDYSVATQVAEANPVAAQEDEVGSYEVDGTLRDLHAKKYFDTLSERIVESLFADKPIFFSIDGIMGDIEWSPESLVQIRNRVNQRIDQSDWGNAPIRVLAQTITPGESISRAFVLVHAIQWVATATAKMLQENPVFQNVPRLALASENYRITSPELLNQLSSIRYSQGGEVPGFQIDTAELHFAGGIWGFCLSTAIKDLLATSARERLAIFIHTPLSYDLIFQPVVDRVTQGDGGAINHSFLEKYVSLLLDVKLENSGVEFKQNQMRGMRYQLIIAKKTVDLYMVTDYSPH